MCGLLQDAVGNILEWGQRHLGAVSPDQDEKGPGGALLEVQVALELSCGGWRAAADRTWRSARKEGNGDSATPVNWPGSTS